MQKGSEVQAADAVQTILGGCIMLVLLPQTIVRVQQFIRQGLNFHLYNLEGVDCTLFMF